MTVAAHPDLSREEVFARLAQSAAGDLTLVTPNRRLALVLQRDFGEYQRRHGQLLWESADILPWTGFLERAFEDARHSGTGPLPLVLAPAQAHALWENLLRDSPGDGALLAVADAARMAHEAWQQVLTWRLEPRLRGAALNEDGKAFQSWSPRYARRLRRDGLIDAAELADCVLPLLRDGIVRRPRTLIACGFDSFTPQQADFLGGLRQSGCEVLQAVAAPQAGRMLRVPCADAEREIRQAATWARSRLEAGCRRIGIVVPDLGARRADIVRIFSAAMAPDYALPAAPSRVLPFNLSLGMPLADYPLAGTALLLLEMTGRDIAFERASRVLRSPFIAGGENERSARAVLDAELRRCAEPGVTLDRLQELLSRHGGDCPLLARCLAALAEFRRSRLFGAQVPSSWARAFSGALAVAGFPGERALDSAEYQTLKRWHEVVAGFAALDRVVPRMGHAEALSRLRRIAADTLFQPESPDVPIQILGVLETPGLDFDCLWVMGLDDENWPPPPRPNPFLPLAVQRAAGLPQCSAAQGLEFSRLMMARWQAMAPEVVLSFPLREDDRELQPSPLIAAVAGAQPDGAACADFGAAIHAARAVEALAADPAPPLAGAAVTGGGTALLRDQAACPFRAYAAHRLHARAPEAPHAGLDALERGTLVHRVLAQAWMQLRDSATLSATGADRLDALLSAAADAAIECIRRERPTVLSGRFADIEKRRLIALARASLDCDRARNPFAVIAVEDKRTMTIGGLRLNARLDRVDETADGRRIIIDYKTGDAKTAAMLGERPDEPQLPLYLTTTEPGAAAVAFARVSAGKTAYVGLARDSDLLPGISAYADSRQHGSQSGWDGLVAAWRGDLERIAGEFAGGLAAVDPKRRPHTCQYCDLGPLCRIRERSGATIDDGGED